MGDLFTAIILGHLVGDYVLQNDWMALNKVKWNDEGWLAAFVHCICYSTAVTTSLLLCGFKHIGYANTFELIWLVTFMSHFPIDKVSLAKYWMRFYGHSTDVTKNPFTPLVYVVIDNTMHLIIMMVAFSKLLVK